MSVTIEQYAKPGEILTCFDGMPYSPMGVQYRVTHVSSEPMTDMPPESNWNGRHFVIANRVRKNGKTGKRQRTFIVSPDGSVCPADNE